VKGVLRGPTTSVVALHEVASPDFDRRRAPPLSEAAKAVRYVTPEPQAESVTNFRENSLTVWVPYLSILARIDRHDHCSPKKGARPVQS
jgi:hypothetical protein